uniref:Uncharacterized protein n=1 Tax=Anguilla anguilla TaxID=7936 RepID=A0A0E9WBW8_ANGAN
MNTDIKKTIHRFSPTQISGCTASLSTVEGQIGECLCEQVHSITKPIILITEGGVFVTLTGLPSTILCPFPSSLVHRFLLLNVCALAMRVFMTHCRLQAFKESFYSSEVFYHF